MTDTDKKQIVVCHVGDLPRTSLVSSLLTQSKALQRIIAIDVEVVEARIEVQIQEGLVQLSKELKEGTTLRVTYPYVGTGKREKKVAPYGKKAKRVKGYPR